MLISDMNNLNIKQKYFLRAICTIVIIFTIALVTLDYLGSKSRTGYLEVVSPINQTTYNTEFKSYSSFFKNNDIYNSYIRNDSFPSHISDFKWIDRGIHYSSHQKGASQITSTQPLQIGDKIDNVSYIVGLQSTTYVDVFYVSIALIAIAFIILFPAFYMPIILKTIEYIKDFFTKQPYAPFWIYSFCMFVFFLTIEMHGDDMWFYNISNDYSLWQYIIMRLEWSSRVIVDILLYLLPKAIVLWAVITSLLILLMCCSIAKLISSTSWKTNIIIVLVLMLCPMADILQLGWIAPTLNYYWQIPLAFYILLPIKQHMNDEKISNYQYLFTLLAMLFMIGNEQVTVMMLFFLTISAVYLTFINKRSLFVYFQTILVYINLAFILLLPGNESRTEIETERWFPEFVDLTLFQKLEIGYSSTLYKFIFEASPFNTVFIILSLMLFYQIMTTQKCILRKIISGIPLVISVTFGWLSGIFSAVFPFIKTIQSKITVFGTSVSISEPSSFIPDIILTIVCISLLLSIYFAMQDKRKAIISVIVIIVGFGSRMMMGLAPLPTDMMSRTFIFMYFSFFVAILMLYMDSAKLQVLIDTIASKVMSYLRKKANIVDTK